MEQRSKEWFELRKNKIGASDAPVIMGVGFKTPYQLWLEKWDLSENSYSSDAMKHGLETEPKALELFNKVTGHEMKPEVLISDERNWQMASLDGFCKETSQFVEIKCPYSNANDHEYALSGHVPDKYIPQLAHQFLVTKADKGWYFSFFKDSHAVISLDREMFEDSYMQELIQKEKEFWVCVENFIPPKMNGKDYVFREDEEFITAAYEWKLAKKKLDFYEHIENNCREKLKELCNNKNVRGAGVKITKIISKGSVQYDKIPLIETVNLEDYRKSNRESWRITEDAECAI